jgi:hypothetical protein
MLSWTPFPFTGAYVYDPGCVAQHWKRLHAGDAEPMPGDDACFKRGRISTTALFKAPSSPAWIWAPQGHRSQQGVLRLRQLP